MNLVDSILTDDEQLRSLTTSGIEDDIVEVSGKDLNGEEYSHYVRVLDGDTTQRQKLNEETGEYVDDDNYKPWRLKGIQSPELSHSVNGKWTSGDVGGLDAKEALKTILKNQRINIDSSKVQDFGAGEGKRDVVGLSIGETGESLPAFLLSNGLADTTTYSSESDYISKILGDINRKVNPTASWDSPYANLRENRETGATGVKSYADTQADFNQYPDKYHSKSFYDRDRTSDGYTTGFGVLTTALNQGWQNTQGLLGGGAAAIGTLFGDDTALEDWGNAKRLVSEYKSSNLAQQKINQLSDIDSVMDFLQWTTVKAGESAPFMVALIGGSLAAPVVGALSGSAAAGTAAAVGVGALRAGQIATGAARAGSLIASTAPSAVLHAGEIFNQLDPEARTKENAAYSIMLGTAAGALDAFSLRSIFKPSQVLDQAGRDKIAAEIAKRNGIPEAVAAKQLKKAIGDSAAEYLTHANKLADLEKRMAAALTSKLAKGSWKVGEAVGKESLTEAGQEVITTLGAKTLNIKTLLDDALDPDGSEDSVELIQNLDERLKTLAASKPYVSIFDIAGVVGKELTEYDSKSGLNDLQKQVLEAAVAGGVLGGGLSAATQTYAYGKDAAATAIYKQLRGPLDQDTGLTKEQQISYDNRGDGNLGSQQDALADAIQSNESGGSAVSIQGGKTINVKKGSQTYIDLAQKGKSAKSFIGKVVSDVTKEGNLPTSDETISAVRQGGRKLFLAPLRVVKDIANTDYLKASRGVRLIASSIGGLTSGYAGRAFESAKEGIIGGLDSRFGADQAAELFNFNVKHAPSRKAYSKILRAYSKFRSKNGRVPTATELEAIIPSSTKRAEAIISEFKSSINQDKLDALEILDDNLIARAEEQLKIVNEARVRAGLEPIPSKKDWHNRHQGIDKSKANADRVGFEQLLYESLGTLTPESLRKYNVKNKREASKQLAEKILTGASSSEAFSLLFGQGDYSSAKETKLDLSSHPDFQKFADEDIFSTMEKASSQAARHAVHLDYFGNNNEKLSAMFEMARAELSETYPADKVEKDLAQLAQIVSDIIDASDSNYNRIESESVAKLQAGILSYTTLSGMLLAGFASIPEFAAIAVGLRGSVEWNSFWNSTGKHLLQGLKNSYKLVFDSQYLGNNPKVFNAAQKAQKKMGQPNDNEFLQNKFNTAESNIVQGGKFITEVFDKSKDFMFFLNMLQGVTSIQRGVATDVGFMFILNQLSILNDPLISVSEADGTVSINPTTVEQRDAYVKLQQSGVHPEALVAQARLITDSNVESSQVHNDFQDQLFTGVNKFVNTRIQNPGAANRPLIMQDPHFALLTQFNGFLSAVTTQLVPKIWNEEFMRGFRTSSPSITYPIVSALLLMFAFNGLGNWMKELLKHWQLRLPTDSKYLSGPGIAQRAVFGSGAFGQYEKVLDIFVPLYPQPGEGPLKRTQDVFTGTAGRLSAQVQDLLTVSDQKTSEQRVSESVRDALNLIPGLSQLTALRSYATEKATGSIAPDETGQEIFGVRN